MTALAKGGSGTSLLDWAIAYWWLILIFGGAVLEWFGEIFDCGFGAVRHALKVRHKRRLQLARARARAARPLVPDAGPRPLPGACVHRRVKQVRDMDGNLVAWLCLKEGCEKQLPADWAIAQEDL